MSNSLFENPKIALGFAGVVVAVALVASVALDQFTPDAEQAEESDGTAEAQAPALAAQPQQTEQQGFAQEPSNGWGDGGAGWGTPAGAPTGGQKKQGLASASAEDPFAKVGPVENQINNNGGGGIPSGPRVSTRAAPGAPEVGPPGGRSRGTLETTGE